MSTKDKLLKDFTKKNEKLKQDFINLAEYTKTLDREITKEEFGKHCKEILDNYSV